jgi:hypothetical protein
MGKSKSIKDHHASGAYLTVSEDASTYVAGGWHKYVTQEAKFVELQSIGLTSGAKSATSARCQACNGQLRWPPVRF